MRLLLTLLACAIALRESDRELTARILDGKPARGDGRVRA